MAINIGAFNRLVDIYKPTGTIVYESVIVPSGDSGQLIPVRNSPANDGRVVLTFVDTGLVLDMTDAPEWSPALPNSVRKWFIIDGVDVLVSGLAAWDTPYNTYPDVNYFEYTTWPLQPLPAGFVNGDVSAA